MVTFVHFALCLNNNVLVTIYTDRVTSILDKVGDLYCIV